MFIKIELLFFFFADKNGYSLRTHENRCVHLGEKYKISDSSELQPSQARAANFTLVWNLLFCPLGKQITIVYDLGGCKGYALNTLFFFDSDNAKDLKQWMDCELKILFLEN